MAASDKTIDHLLQLPTRAARTTRPDLLGRALFTAILLFDADAATAVLATPRGRGERLVLYAGSETAAALPPIVEASEALRTLSAERQALAVPDLSEHAALAGTDTCPGVEAGPVLFVPVDQGGTLPAYLAVYRKRGRARYSAQETELLLLVAAWLGTALENLRHVAAAEKLVLTDDATQIYNARFLELALRREIRRADRHGQELALVRVELDAFDALREAHGRTRTARLVKRLAAVLGKQVRAFDLLGKEGEGAFLALLPQTSRDEAAEVAERMRAAVLATAFAPAPAGAVTAAFGVASFPHDGVDAEALFAVADRALHEARAKGGNCVATAARKAA